MSGVRRCDRCEERTWTEDIREVTLEFGDGSGNIMSTSERALCPDCVALADEEGYL